MQATAEHTDDEYQPSMTKLSRNIKPKMASHFSQIATGLSV